MKKFTEKFLLGGHGFGTVLRKIGLSMVAILFSWAVIAQADPGDPQETLHVWAENADDDCYRQDNLYEVDILVKDFVKIDTFVLVLDYDEPTVFSYVDYTNLDPVLDATGTFDITETTSGRLQIVWDSNDDPVNNGTIEPNNDTTVVFTLRFELDGFHHNYGSVAIPDFSMNLEWVNSMCKYWNQYPSDVTNILTDMTFDGSLLVTQTIPDVVVESGMAGCSGDAVLAVVTSPVGEGYEYSFNNGPWSSSPEAEVMAPYCCNTVRVRHGECISYIRTFETEAPAPLTFNVKGTPFNARCPGGAGIIEINASGGSKPYTYYVIPEGDWYNQVVGDLEDAMTKEEGMEAVADYATSNNLVERSPGTYIVAVQDNNECVDLRYTTLGIWWREAEVVDENDPWEVTTDDELSKLMLDCWLEPDVTTGDGRIAFDISGATPYVDGYNIWMNDQWVGRMFEYDSGVKLIADTYDFHITDSLGCCYDVTYNVDQPEPITFLVDHTDASCNANVGTITIDTESIEGGSGSLDYWWWIYSTDPDFGSEATDTIWASDGGVFTTADSLPPAVYYVTVFDSIGCDGKYVNENGDNAIKVLTTEFDLVYEPIQCNGDSTVVSIVLTSGAGNHEFEYGYVNAPGDTSWQESNVFHPIYAGNHTFVLHDITIDCILAWTEPVEEPAELTAHVVDGLTVPPTCPGNSDGNLYIMAQGGIPFESEGGVEYYKYKLDNNDWVKFSDYATFAIDTARHEILVQDANGCTTTIMFDWEKAENYIAFQDTIWNMCPLEMVNLFNAWSGNDSWWEVGLDEGYLEDFEWYGIPIEHFTGAIGVNYWFWTSDSGWIWRPLQGFQQARNPMFYITDVDPQGNPQSVVDNGEMIGHTSVFGAGDYWIVATDEWGCFSNIEKLVIIDPPKMEVEVSTEPAGCAGSTDGKIILKAFNGQWDIPLAPVRYQYVLTQQPQIFNWEEWWAEARWVAFTSGDFNNDSLAVINVQKGTYWVAVRDYCGVINPDSLIQYFGPIEIEGAEPIEVDWNVAQVTDVTCNTYGVDDNQWTDPVPSDDGSITGLLAATTGGFGGYTFYLDWSDCGNDRKNGVVDDGYTWPIHNTTGDFTGLPAGCYTLTIMDTMDCQVVIPLEIEQPDPFGAKVDVVNASCYDSHDGLLRYKFFGGTAPYEEATNNVGIWETPSDIPEERWYDVSSDTVNVHDFIAFDRRVRAGHKQIWVRDAQGCIFGPLNVVVDQPDKLDVTDVVVKDVSCNDLADQGTTNDGCITFTPVGGWNIEEVSGVDSVFMYYAELWKAGGTAPLETQTYNVLQDIEFCGYAAGDYLIKLYEYSEDIAGAGYEGPITTEQNYFLDWHTWSGFAPYQNPDTTQCYVLENVTIGEPDDITYDEIVWRDMRCHNEVSGEIYVPGITGGTPSLVDGYYVALQGPEDHDPGLQSDYATSVYNDSNPDLVWFKTGAGVNEFTFDHLIWGHYTVHIMDSAGCWIYKESGEIENPDTLMITRVELLNEATCYGGEGKIQIDATGGVGEYMYAVDSTLVPDPGSHLFPDDLDLTEYIENLEWQSNDTFMVTAATWIGYVMDENGCVVGFSTNAEGAPIYHHRVTVTEPDPVEADGFDQVEVTCYGNSDGEITIEDVWGGTGTTWAIHVSGTDYEGNDVDTTYIRTSSSDLVLGGLPASTNETDVDSMTADDWYYIVIEDIANCYSEEYKQFVLQPEEFEVVLKDKQNAFVCPNDQAGIFEIEVVSGGTPYGIGPDNEPLYEYKWEAYEDEGYSMLIDSLTDNIYGFTKTFLGYAGIYYRVWARDANMCTTHTDTFIQAPDPIEFDVRNLTCYGDDLASARVIATGTEGRSFQVLYKEILDGTSDTEWTVYNGWFTDSIDIIEEFIYDGTNLRDRHYAILVEDDMGCRSLVDTMTFDPVQHELTVEAMIEGNEITAEAMGGAVDDELNHHYQYAISVVGETDPDPVWQTDNMFIVEEYNEYVVWARDYHLRCTATDTVSGGVAEMTIAEIQGEVDSSLVTGEVVQVSGTVTGVVEGEGFFMQDANAEWSGIWVDDDGENTVVVGDGAVVVGEVAEVDNVTTLMAMSVEVIEATLTVDPLLLESPSAAINEKYESVLTKVGGARATAAVEGQWGIYYETSDSVIVSNLMFTYEPTEDHYYDVTGVVNGMLNAFTMEPRMESDIVDITETTPAALNPENIEFKVYPNPFQNYIYIDNYDKLTRVVLTDIAGKRVIDIEYPSREIRTDNLVSGVYVVSMFTENGRAKTERIVKW